MQLTLVILDHKGEEINCLALDPYDLRNPIETMALINEICATSHRQTGEINLQLLSHQVESGQELNYALETLNAAIKALVKFDHSIRSSQADRNSCDTLALNLSWIEELISLVTELNASPAWSDHMDCKEKFGQSEPAFYGAVL